MVSSAAEFVLDCDCSVCFGNHDDEIREQVLPIVANACNAMEGGNFDPNTWMVLNSNADKLLREFKLFAFFSKLNNVHALFRIKKLQIEQEQINNNN